jgi:flagellin
MASSAASSVNKAMETSMNRLSTGLRINTAADDAAGVAIASRLTAEIRGTNQAIRNAADAQALVDTAEGAHVEIDNILQRMRELAVQSANDTNAGQDRTYLQAEMEQLVSEIDRIAATTTWAGQNVMDGTFASKNFQIGARSNETLTTSVNSMASASIGQHKIDSTAAANTAANSATATHTTTDFDILGPLGSAQVDFSAQSSAKVVAAAVNNDTSATGVIATAVTKAKLSSVAAGASTLSVNGTALSFTIQSTTDLTALKDAFNAVAGTTGVTAAFDGTSKAALILTDGDGDNIALADYTNGTATASVRAMNYDGTDLSASAAITLTSGGADSSIVTGSFRLSANGAFSVAQQQAGSTATTTAVTGYFNTGATASSSLSAVSAVDIGTTSGASSAINVIDGALRMVSSQRADLGAISNRLDSTVSNLTNISTNLEAGRSSIQDADFAAESTALAKAQILQQASTAMLAQANASKQGVLQLLQG